MADNAGKMTRHFSVALADWTRNAEIIMAIRREVFIIEQGVAEALEIDPQDYLHTHVLAFADNNHNDNRVAIATGRLASGENIIDIGGDIGGDTGGHTAGDTAHIGRMAVLAAWRGCGVGGAVLKHLIDIAQSRGIKHVKLHAQVHAESFYRAHQFARCGEEFIEAGIVHIAMTRTLS